MRIHWLLDAYLRPLLCILCGKDLVGELAGGKLRSWKSKMADATLEVAIYRLADTLKSKFQRLIWSAKSKMADAKIWSSNSIIMTNKPWFNSPRNDWVLNQIEMYDGLCWLLLLVSKYKQQPLLASFDLFADDNSWRLYATKRYFSGCRRVACLSRTAVQSDENRNRFTNCIWWRRQDQMWSHFKINCI